MKKDCSEVRERLASAREAASSADLRSHLDACPDCGRYAETMNSVREFLRSHHGNFEPDPAFATRVAARLPGKSADLLGWAAMRLLPATLALAAVLAWFAFQSAPYPEVEQVQAPTDDLLAWVLEQSEDGP